MSEQEEIKLFKNINDGILEAQRRLFERKAKLGENVIVADANGMPVEITAEEALKRINNNLCSK